MTILVLLKCALVVLGIWGGAKLLADVARCFKMPPRSPLPWEVAPIVDDGPIKTARQCLLDATSDQALDLVFYDRKEDPDLPLGMIEALLENGEITVEEIVAQFKRSLRENLGLRAQARQGGLQ